MGSNPTQAMGITCTLVAFTLLGLTFAGGGILAGVGFLVFQAAGVFFFMKCKPWENQSPDSEAK